MYVQTLMVMPSDTACTGEIKIKALLDYLQDIAGLAVQDLEGSPGELIGRGYAWVLLRYEVDVVSRMPAMDERFQVRTWHATEDGFHTLRAFELDNLSGTPLVRAKTSWVLIDLAAARPVRAGQRLPEIFSLDALPIAADFREIPRPSGGPFHERHFHVRFHDLDANEHVNNAVYFEWAYEATPLDLLGYGMREMRAEFRVSARLGDTIAVRAEELEPADSGTESRLKAYAYTMLDAAGREKRPLARLYAAWEPLDGFRSAARGGASS